MLANSRRFWKVLATPSLVIRSGGKPLIRLPWNSTSPSLGANMPVMQLKKVVLPAPLGPIRPTIWPGPTVRSTSRTATSPPNRRVTLRASRIGVPSSLGLKPARPWSPWSVMSRS